VSAANTELLQVTKFCTADRQLCGKVEFNWMLLLLLLLLLSLTANGLSPGGSGYYACT